MVSRTGLKWPCPETNPFDLRLSCDQLVYGFYQIDALGILLDDGQMPDIGEGHLLGVELFHYTPIGLELMLGALYQ